MREALSGLTVRGRACLAAGITAVVCAILLGQPTLTRVGVLVAALPVLTAYVLGRSRYRLALVRSVETGALKTPDDLEAARDLVARHGSAAPQDGSPTWRMLVAPAKGTIRRVDLPEGTVLEPGTAVGTLVSLRDESPVVAPHGGTVVEWLVEDGDPVSPGQPLVRLHPESE